MFEGDGADIQMIIEGRSPDTRHVSRTHGVDLYWLFETVDLGSSNFIRYVNTKEQTLRDTITKGSFTVFQWNDVMRLVNICTDFS